MTYTVNIRSKRQVTLPRELLDHLDLEVGDYLNINLEDGKVLIEAKKNISVDAMSELKRIIRNSGVSESDAQKSVRKFRQKLHDEKAS